MPPILVLFALIFAQPAELETRMIVVSNAHFVGSRCGIPGSFPACTRFVGHQLNADCASTAGGAFTMRVRSRFTALVYITSGEYMRHEYLHIEDMERAVARHIERLESYRFETRPACERAARAAAESFADALQAFAAASNAERQ